MRQNNENRGKTLNRRKTAVIKKDTVLKHDPEFYIEHRNALDYIIKDMRRDGVKIGRDFVAEKLVEAVNKRIQTGTGNGQRTRKPLTVHDVTGPDDHLRAPKKFMVECMVERLVACRRPVPVPTDFLLLYLEMAGYPNPHALLVRLGVPGCYSKYIPQKLPLIAREADIERGVSFIRSGDRILHIGALSGMGKTAVAIHIANELKEEMQAVIWVNIERNLETLTLEHLVDNIANHLHINGFNNLKNKPIQLCDIIRREQHTILLVIDNFNALPSIEQQKIGRWLCEHFSAVETCRTLITSQGKSEFIDQRYVELPFRGLDADPGAQLISNRLGGHFSIPEETLKRISIAAGGNPQILKSASGWLKEFVTPEQIIDSLRSGCSEWHEHFYKWTWDRLTTDVKQVVLSASLFHKSVSYKTLKQVSGLGDKFDSAFKRARALYLVDDLGLAGGRVGQHELVRRVAEREEISSKMRERWCHWTVKFASDFDRDQVWNNHHLLEKLEQHDGSELANITAVIDWCESQERWQEFFALASNLRYFFHTRGDWEAEKSLSLRRYSVAQRVGNDAEAFSALVYHVNVACKQENKREINAHMPELERLWLQREKIGIKFTDCIEYHHVQAQVERIRQHEGWKEKCLDLWQGNLERLGSWKPQASDDAVTWKQLDFLFNVNMRYLATHFLDMGNEDKARELFHEALRHSENRNFERAVIWVKIKLAALDIRQFEFESALEILEGGEETLILQANNIQGRREVAEIEMLTAEALSGLGRLEEALLRSINAHIHLRRLGQSTKAICVAKTITKLKERLGHIGGDFIGQPFSG